jgi:hypothetical protein
VYTAVAIVKVMEAREKMTNVQPHSSARVGPQWKEIMHAKTLKAKVTRSHKNEKI